MKSGYAKKYVFQKFLGKGRGWFCKGDLEKSRFDWVFLNVGLPYLQAREMRGERIPLFDISVAKLQPAGITNVTNVELQGLYRRYPEVFSLKIGKFQQNDIHRLG